MHKASMIREVRWFIILPLIFFLSACSPCCRQWEIEWAIAPCPIYNSGRIFLPVTGSDNNLELEFRRSSSGITAYLSVYFLALPYVPQNPDLLPVKISIGKSSTIGGFAERL